MLRVSLLGGLSLRNDEAIVTGVDTPRMQALLAYLLLHRDTPQPRSHLAFLFWPDTSEAQARTNLRNLLHQLRRAFPDFQAYLEINTQTLQWQPAIPVILDVAEFKTALVVAKQGSTRKDITKILQTLSGAIDLYKGDLLPSCYDDWIVPHREELRDAYLNALENMVDLLEEQRDYKAAIQYAQRILREDPLQEASYRDLIRLHALNSDRAAALRVYHTCTTVLRRELDVEPSTATRAAYQKLLGVIEKPSSPATTTVGFSPLVGREREWLQLLQAWKVAVDGTEPQIIFLSGVAGIGKTRLVEEMVQWADRQGISRASARCYAAEGSLAFAPITTWLRSHPLASLNDVWLGEVARILPEVLTQRPDLPRAAPMTDAWQRQHLFEGLSRAILCMNQPLLLTIDDLQWCDRDTLEYLHFLLRFDQQAQVLIIGTYRPEEIEADHPLEFTLKALRQEGHVVEVDLQPLDEKSTTLLATAVAGSEIDTETAENLFRETEGNPLFVVETVRAGLQYRDQLPDSLRDRNPHPLTMTEDTSLPVKVQSIIKARLAQLSASSRELAGLAATIGREFTVKLLLKCSGDDEDTLVRELDELWQKRIIREHGIDGYDFSHDKLREVAYHSMSTARRKMLHHTIAQALEGMYSTDLDPISHQVAAHYDLAGLPEQAIPYYLKAAKVARRVYANEEAIVLLQRGLELVGEYELAGVENKIENAIIPLLWEELGDVLEIKAEHERAGEAYQNALGRIGPGDRICNARLHLKKGIAMREQRNYQEALTVCNQAEIALGEPPDAHDSIWWREWIDVQVERIWAYYWLAQWPEMEALVNKARPVVQDIGGSAVRARFLMAVIMPLLRKNRYRISDEMMVIHHEALAASLDWGDMKTRVECQFELGFLHLWRHELDEAEESLKVALDLIEITGMVPFKTLTLTYLTVVKRFKGQVEQVSNYASWAMKIAEAAHMPDYIAAARGNQAWLAWRNGDLEQTKQNGQAALKLWHQSPLVYPFQWMALWPLIGVTMATNHEEEAWLYIQALLDPLQQLLPVKLDDVLEAAVQAKTTADSISASQFLHQSIVIARDLGYL